MFHVSSANEFPSIPQSFERLGDALEYADTIHQPVMVDDDGDGYPVTSKLDRHFAVDDGDSSLPMWAMLFAVL